MNIFVGVCRGGLSAASLYRADRESLHICRCIDAHKVTVEYTCIKKREREREKKRERVISKLYNIYLSDTYFSWQKTVAGSVEQGMTSLC